MFYAFSPQKGMNFFYYPASCYFLLSIFPAQKNNRSSLRAIIQRISPKHQSPLLGIFCSKFTQHTLTWHGSIVIAQAAAHSTVVINYRQSSTPWHTVVPQFYDKRDHHTFIPFLNSHPQSLVKFFLKLHTKEDPCFSKYF